MENFRFIIAECLNESTLDICGKNKKAYHTSNERLCSSFFMKHETLGCLGWMDSV